MLAASFGSTYKHYYSGRLCYCIMLQIRKLRLGKVKELE